MGYQAPSPEEVYRYALRLDGARSLTDRFGFSILFINDTSPVCRDFLREYCVDLCLRTADRIRFVFFSELRREEFEGIAHEMQSGRTRSMLRSVLELLGIERRVDFERDPWRFLRPRAFRPLRTVDEISERLSWECDLRTAMPGAGMAMEFAQRLGIGRFVPCILVFTEIGNLQVDVLPIAGLTPERIYRHIRTWVDEFYEQNRAIIDEWTKVEGEITGLITRANSSLSEIRDWRNARLRAWETLARVSAVIRAAELGDAKQFERATDTLRYASSLSSATSSLLHEAREALRDAEASKRKAITLRAIAADLAAADRPQLVLARLGDAKDRLRETGEQIPRILDDIKALAQRLELPQTPAGFVKLWWQTANRQKLSLKLFKSELSGWQRAFGVRRVIAFREEFEVIRKAIEELPLCGDAAEGSTAVVRRYGEHLGVDVASDAWTEKSEHYRSVVQHFLHRLCSTAPEWLRTCQPALTIGESFPRPQELELSSIETLLRARPRLQAAIDEATTLATAAVQDDIAKTIAISLGYRDVITAELEARARQLDVPQGWATAFLADALPELRAARRRLEVAALSAAKENPPRGSEWNDELAGNLHRALDTYAELARSLRYPHRDDPQLRRVSIDVPLPVAAGVERQRDSRDFRASSLKTSLDAAAASAASYPQVRSEASVAAIEAMPSARLALALRASVAEDRLRTLVPAAYSGSFEAGVDALVAGGRTAEFLRALDSQEQQAIASALAEGTPENVQGGQVDQPVDAALLALGLYTTTTIDTTSDDAARTLRRKVLADDFDVFMAHNSVDKPAIVELGRRLRVFGVHPWIDVEQIPPGRWFQDVIQAVIPRVRAAAIFVGSAGLGRWQALELRAFISACVERGLPVIPVLLPGASDLPQDALFLRELNYVRFIGNLGDEEALGRLVWGITGEKPVLAS